MTYQELANLLRNHESSYPKTHLTAYITFSSFGPHNEETYSWEGRTYVISSNNKAFQPNKSGYSIFGSCLDGSDPCVRLDKYMQEEHGGEDGRYGANGTCAWLAGQDADWHWKIQPVYISSPLKIAFPEGAAYE